MKIIKLNPFSCLVVSLAISIWFFFYFESKFPQVCLEIDFEASEDGILQVYYSSGDSGYAEGKSFTYPYSSDQRVTFKAYIPSYQLHNIRVDPDRKRNKVLVYNLGINGRLMKPEDWLEVVCNAQMKILPHDRAVIEWQMNSIANDPFFEMNGTCFEHVDKSLVIPFLASLVIFLFLFGLFLLNNYFWLFKRK